MSGALSELSAADANARLPELAALLVDVVDGGASVGFLRPLSNTDAAAFWRGRLADFVNERAVLIGALGEDGALVGTVVLNLALMPNGRHRAEVTKLLVRTEHRRQGLGEALLQAAEFAAKERGRTRLVLDALTGGDAERLYRRCGWVEVGRVDDYALTVDGELAPTTYFTKSLVS